MQALATSYKQRLYFPFNLSKQHHSKQGLARAAELEPLLQSPILDLWAAALNDMTYPAQRWQAWVSQLDRLLTDGDKVGKLVWRTGFMRRLQVTALRMHAACQCMLHIKSNLGCLWRSAECISKHPAAHLVLRWTQISRALRMACYIVCACQVWQISEALQYILNVPERGGFMCASYVQIQAAKLYAGEVYPDMVGRHKGRSERGHSSIATYNAQVRHELDAELAMA